MMIKLKVIRRVVDSPIAIKKQIKEERNILVRNVQGGGLLGRPSNILKTIFKRILTVRLTGYKADNGDDVVQDRV